MSTESDYFGSRAEDYSGQPARSNLQAVSDSGRLEGRQQTPYAGSAPLERYPTSHLEPIDDPRGAHSRTNTAPTTISRFQTANDDERVLDRDPTHAEDLNRQRIERKQEQKVPVDDEYYSLNPWYGQQPDKPLFGLSNPFPRTVRAGMRRPRRTLKESEFRATGQQTSAAEREGIQTGDAAQVRQPQSRGTGVDRKASKIRRLFRM